MLYSGHDFSALVVCLCVHPNVRGHISPLAFLLTSRVAPASPSMHRTAVLSVQPCFTPFVCEVIRMTPSSRIPLSWKRTETREALATTHCQRKCFVRVSCATSVTTCARRGKTEGQDRALL